jgi:hypothetical protein
MCKKCVKVEYPDRGNACLEDGSYYLNFSGCAKCQGLDVLKVENRTSLEDVDGMETTTYDHICKNCNHVVANHMCTFRVEDEFQEYEMSCLLCGNAEDSRSIMPCDPRQQPMYL